MPRREERTLSGGISTAGPRVLLDATAVPADRGGVGRYVDGLLPALDRAAADLAVACQVADVAHYRRIAPSARVLPAPAPVARRPVRLVWEQTGLPVLAARARAEVIHTPHYTMPVRAGRPVVVTLHDATFFTDPGVHTAVKGRFFRAATRAALHRAARCLTPSAATRDELVRVAGADLDRVDVAHHGVDQADFHPPQPAECQRVRDRLGLGDQAYIAFLSTLEPRKNVPALIHGWVRACQGRADPPALVLAGGRGWDDRIDAAVAGVPPELRLIRSGYLPLAELPGFLGGALLVAYPSLGEGFGLPVLEAMACGAAVLTTDRLALPEVGGAAVAYTEPDADSIAAALTGLLDAPARRAELASAGLRRAAGFSWDACARVHLQTYARAAT